MCLAPPQKTRALVFQVFSNFFTSARLTVCAII